MHIIVNKCEFITFSRKKTHSFYKRGDFLLNISEVIRDMGLLLDIGLHFQPHIEQVCNNSTPMLNKRQSVDIKKHVALLVLVLCLCNEFSRV